ncbi:MAG: single-stranded-DNA-specific exonuclease RecJ [Clostridium sp.]
MEQWVIKGKHGVDANELGIDMKLNPLICRILINRGITNVKDMNKFIHPTIKDLYSGTLMKDLSKAVGIIIESIKKEENILIVGDYDVDGVSSTYILYKALSRLGAKVSFHIPDRVTEGYGINEAIIRNAYKNKIDLILTCDNGIAAIEQVKLAKELSMKVIITDHHDIPFMINDGIKIWNIPQADAIVNHKQEDCKYPFKSLCGAGVVFKLIEELYKYYLVEKEELYEFLEIVAMATVCDVVELRGENRIIVKEGLRRIQSTSNLGLKALIEETACKDKKITTYSLGFVIGPCINATGRLETASLSVELLLCDDEIKAKESAKRLVELNKNRQDLTMMGVEKTIDIIEKSSMQKNKIIVVYLEGVHESIAGIIAGRIKERYNLPTIILTKVHNGVKGSARSIELYNIYEELSKCKELLGKFGGHPMAAGLSLDFENIDLLRDKLNKNCTLRDEDVIPKIIIDLRLPLSNASLNFAEEIQSLEPFGTSVKKPCFAEKNIRISSAKILGEKKNVLKLRIPLSFGKGIDAIYFGDIDKFIEDLTLEYGTYEVEKLFKGTPNCIFLDLVFNLNINEYMDRKNPQINIISYRVTRKI